MDAGTYQESSSSLFSRCRYQVFLSFRGEDTRKNFTDHLYSALVQAGIHTFRDNDEIRRGESIDLELRKAIQQSRMSIIVFSKDYALSRWCLDELVMIMEHRRTSGCMVLPVFYDVDPSQVRKQTGSFTTAFVEHGKRFKDEMKRVNRWRSALKEVAELAGMVLGDGYQAQFVHSIVEKVSKKLDRKIFHVPLHFIGRDSLINCINSWLQDWSQDAGIAVLYGIGGVGKTTIAKSVYNQNFDKFEGRSFLANVRKRSKESNGLVCLQRQLFSDLLNKTPNEMYDVDEGITKIKDALCCRRTLIVLDDVSTRDQFKSIIGMRNWLYQGSRIIVTTRNKGLISVHEDECVEFKIKPLDNKESLELFSWHSFGQAHPIKEFAEHSKRMVSRCNGLPLALRVIGSSLCGKGTEVWKSALQEIEVIPNFEVVKVLRVSYDSLDDDYQKNLFLDIACFFNGMNESYVVKILDGLGIGAMCRIDNLIDRGLLEKDKDKRLCMHQLIRDMGREVARQESSKCQRIWHHLEAFTVLKETTDTETVRGLTLDMLALMEDNCTNVVRGEDPIENSILGLQLNFFQRRLHAFSSQEWLSNFFLVKQVQTGRTSLCPILGTNAFRKMQNVKFLQLNYVKFDGSYKYFPKSLVWLYWHGFSLRSIPKHFCLEKLVVLDLSRSSLVEVWKGKMSLPKLKILDLRHSLGLLKTPDFSGLPCLEELILEGCIRLVQIHESIGDLSNLLILNLRNCKRLVELPEEVCRLSSLENLVLDGCSNLDGLNLELEQLQRRRKNYRFTSFTLPCFLVELDLSGTPIRSLPESIKGFSTLNYLWLGNCQMLQRLSELPSNLYWLYVPSCFSLQTIPNILPHFIHVEDCEKLVHTQHLLKLELIQKASLHMFRIMETVIQEQPFVFQILLKGEMFHVLLPGIEFSRFYMKGDEWVIEKEFQDYLSFKISNSSAEHRVCGLDIFSMFSATSESKLNYQTDTFFLEIKNNTKGRSRWFSPEFFLIQIEEEIVELLWLSHWKFEYGELDNGDEVSVSVHTDDPFIQIQTVGVRVWYDQEGNGN